MCSEKKEDTVPTPKEGVKSKLGNWMDPTEMDAELDKKFTGCMKGIYILLVEGGREGEREGGRGS